MKHPYPTIDPSDYPANYPVTDDLMTPEEEHAFRCIAEAKEKREAIERGDIDLSISSCR